MLRAVWTLAVTVAVTLFFSLLAIPGSFLFPRAHVGMRMAKLWSRAILAAAGIRPSFRGLEHLPRDGPCLMLSNHQSMVDIFALVRIAPLPTRFVAKESLFRIPIFGWAMAYAGFIPIDRSNRAKAMRSLERAAGQVRDGHPLILFPEGTRSRNGRLLPFKRGAFHLALQAGVPVVPIAISGSGRTWAPESLRVRRLPVRVDLAPPVDPSRWSVETIDDFVGEVRSRIAVRLDPDERDPDGAPDAS